MYYICSVKRGSSSVGRALASQAKGRGFESRLPLSLTIKQLSLNGSCFSFTYDQIYTFSRLFKFYSITYLTQIQHKWEKQKS